MQLTLAYSISRKPYQGSNFPHNGEVVKLNPKEIFVDVEEFMNRLKLSKEELLAHLKKLEALERIYCRTEKDGLIMSVRDPFMYPEPTSRNEEPNDGEIVPISFNQFKEDLLEHKRMNNKPKTVENDERVLTRFAREYGNVMLHKLTLAHLKDFLEDRKSENPDISPTTLRIDAKTLKAALEMGVEWGNIKENSFRKFRLPKVQRKRTASLTLDEYKAVRERVPTENLKRLFDFAFLSGFRRNEIIFLMWSQIDLDRKIIHVRESEEFSPKQGRERVFRLSDYTIRFLKRIEHVSEYVFVDEQERLYQPNYVTKAFKKCIREAGLDERYKFHSLRATFLTQLSLNGASLMVCRDAAGHSRTTTTENYIDTPSDEILEALRKLRLPGDEDEQEEGVPA